MANLSEKQLIESIKQLKAIEPRKEWAVLLKSQILTSSPAGVKIAEQPVKLAGFFDIFSAIFLQKKLASSFAVLIFMVVGVFGFASLTVPGDLLFPLKKLAEQSQASLTGQPKLKYDVATFNNRINDLAQVAKAGRKNNIPSAVSELNTNVKDLAQNLKNNPTQDADTVKDIVAGLKTLASVQGTDISESKDVIDLYQILAVNQIIELEKTTLTDEQKTALEEVKQLYQENKYLESLEKILLITK